MTKFKVGDLITYNIKSMPSQYCVIREIRIVDFGEHQLWGCWKNTREEAILAGKGSHGNGGWLPDNIAILVETKKPKIYGISKFIDEVNERKYAKI